MHKISIVTRVIFPSASPRANRSTYLANELAKQGYDVTIFCLLGDYNYHQYCNQYKLQVESLGKSYLGNGNSDNGKQISNISFRFCKRLFGKYLMFPEIELCYLIFKKRKQILDADSVISIAHPFAIHFGVGLIKSKFSGVWISDCGDPFTKNPFTRYPAYFKKIEEWWAKNTTYITIPFDKAKFAYPDEVQDKIHVIPQGFPIVEDLDENYTPNKVRTFAFSGNVYPQLRDPTEFLEFLGERKEDFKFIVFTKTFDLFLPFQKILGDKLELRDYISRDDLLTELSKMDFLININNKSGSQLPSKLIDYAISKRPIVNISSKLTLNEISMLERCFLGQYPTEHIDIEQYDIKNVAQNFIKLLESKTNG